MKAARLIKRKWFAVVAVVMSFIFLATPILAQQSDMEAGRIAGEQAARANINSTLWFFAGCCGTWIGLIFAYVYEPSPPALDLLGKSPEYVAAYTDAYKATGKSIQTSKAWEGCITYVATYVALYVILLATSEGTY